MKASASIGGVVYTVKPASKAQRRQLREGNRQLLHTQGAFYAEEGEGARALAASGGSS